MKKINLLLFLLTGKKKKEMDGKRIEGNEVYALVICVSIILISPIVVSQPIPTDKSQVDAWFNGIIKPVKEMSKTLDPELVQMETEPRIIKVMQGGGGEFDTITKAIESVPSGNAKRVIISIGPGSYKEKIRIERNKPFITLVGDPKNTPNLTFDGIAKQYGTVDSATLITESSYFVGANLNIVNTAPRQTENGRSTSGCFESLLMMCRLSITARSSASKTLCVMTRATISLRIAIFVALLISFSEAGHLYIWY
ncbi:pectinesterase 1-like [Gossypium arboreum]|uniref:pectinesterase 1-like n=1 Tax=Gossypium arboreum TaxID=29729 RepID=UPI0022F18D24|nr:pectinesterase 1-like [Gossypium arboreum]